MPPRRIRHSFFLFCLFTFLNHSFAVSQQLWLKVAGDDGPGFRVDICNATHLRADNKEEFPLQIFNYDLSNVVNMQQWKGQKCPIMRKSILKKDSSLQTFDADLHEMNLNCDDANIIKKWLCGLKRFYNDAFKAPKYDHLNFVTVKTSKQIGKNENTIAHLPERVYEKVYMLWIPKKTAYNISESYYDSWIKFS